MTDALTSLDMSTGLRKVAERVKREPAARLHSLAHLTDEALLAGAFARLRNTAAVEVDGITKEQYGQALESNLNGLHERLKTKRYRHQPIRRVHIPKEKHGQRRPIGISTTEDKVVQSAVREVSEAIYEQGLHRILVRVSPRTQRPRCPASPDPSGGCGRGELDPGV
jgi:hypothetical protein